MNSILDEVRSLLEAAGYATRAERPDDPALYFEDECLLGFVRVFDDSESLVSGWKAEQETFLRQNASTLRKDPVKAWNLYAVFLTRGPASLASSPAIVAIEEDFQSMRKIARAGIRTRDELAVVLGPLLPIQTGLVLVPTDVHARLLERLGPDESPRRLLLSDTPPDEIARLVTEEQ